MFVSFCWRMRALLCNSCIFQRIIYIWDKIGYHGNHCEGLLTLCNNLRGAYPNLVKFFWSLLDLISTEQCIFQYVQLHVWQ